jgi:AraC family transcriptional regulator of adaptative response/methylated-DNA-[protein]-cysteine methyltransferase
MSLNPLKVVALPPNALRAKGSGLSLRYGTAKSPFGSCLLAWTGQGICLLHFLDGPATQTDLILKHLWPQAMVQHNQAEAHTLTTSIFSTRGPSKPPTLILSGTPFQLKAWRALLEIPFGETRSYGQLAEAMGNPSAARAAGTAIGANLLAYLVPCHRIIRDTGQTGQYRWGPQRKATILNWEAAQLAAAQTNR